MPNDIKLGESVTRIWGAAREQGIVRQRFTQHVVTTINGGEVRRNATDDESA
jgi:hypothetical protein